MVQAAIPAWAEEEQPHQEAASAHTGNPLKLGRNPRVRSVRPSLSGSFCPQSSAGPAPLAPHRPGEEGQALPRVGSATGPVDALYLEFGAHGCWPAGGMDSGPPQAAAWTAEPDRLWMERHRLHPAAFLGLACCLAAVVLFCSFYTFGTTVIYDGEVVAAVDSRSTAEEARSDLEQITTRTWGRPIPSMILCCSTPMAWCPVRRLWTERPLRRICPRRSVW